MTAIIKTIKQLHNLYFEVNRNLEYKDIFTNERLGQFFRVCEMQKELEEEKEDAAIKLILKKYKDVEGEDYYKRVDLNNISSRITKEYIDDFFINEDLEIEQDRLEQAYINLNKKYKDEYIENNKLKTLLKDKDEAIKDRESQIFDLKTDVAKLKTQLADMANSKPDSNSYKNLFDMSTFSGKFNILFVTIIFVLLTPTIYMLTKRRPTNLSENRTRSKQVKIKR